MTVNLTDLSAVKLALLAKKVRADAAPVLQADPIAVVGMGCRAPGGGDSPDALWRLLLRGADAVCEVPPDRWPGDAWFDPDPSVPARSVTKWGGFLDSVDGFDAAFFNILPREAERMDPQQRLLLEVATEALDDAGMPRERLRGSRTGVFVASYHNDYAQLQYRDLEAIDARTLTGTLHSVLTNRLSYLLDLRGPSVSIDTACSSSLVATHLACQSLRCGEIDLALAGGVSLMLTPDLMVSLSKVGFMAPDGRCKTFDARADGFGRGEGCGVIVLKRLADAIADGDRVLAVVRGSAVNQDGHSTLLAAPNGLAQQAMIREALANAQVAPERIGFVETHGTGTALGDPIEVEALAATIGRPNPGAGPCRLGAAKANFGHLEAAAGVLGLIKTVLVLRHGTVPPQVHFQTLNPHISLDGTRLEIHGTAVPWPAGPRPRCAGVSSFGVGGTNAHVVLEEAPRLPTGDAPTAEVPLILPLSARSPGALRASADAWLRFLPTTPDSPADLCFTAARRRTHHEYRLAVVGRTRNELAARLAEHVAGELPMQGGASPFSGPKVGFVFSGQGPQWHAMGRELLADEPVFRAALAECDALIQATAGWSVIEELTTGEARSRLAATEVAQPALFALQVALAALWRSWGIHPDAVVGHSVGEIAALHVAGVLTLSDAVRVVTLRGRVMQEATGLGRMAEVRLSAQEAADVVWPFGSRLSVAAYNGPRTVVLSGESAALEEAVIALAARGVTHRMLPVNYAFHSAQMAPFARRLAGELAGLAPAGPAVAVYSTVTGAAASDETFDGAYFGRNLGEPVRFASAIAAMADDGIDTFVELGPHPVLAPAIGECVERARVAASLRRGRPERETMLRACATLYAAGGQPAWEAVLRGESRVVALPAYPWQRQRYWIRQRPPETTTSEGADSGHPILGTRLLTAGSTRIFESAARRAPWLADHRLFGRDLMPAAAILETFHTAAGKPLEGFTVYRPLELDGADTRWQTVVAQNGELELHKAVDGAWQLIATATATATPATAAPPTGADPLTDTVDVGAVYRHFAALGVEFGPTFCLLSDVRRGPGVAEGWIDCPAPAGAALQAAVDAGLQLCTIAQQGLPHEVLLPVGADRFQILREGVARLRGHARFRADGAADVALFTPDGEPVVIIEGARFASPATPAGGDVYRVAWHPVPSPAALRTDGVWLILGDRGGAGTALAREIAELGGRATFDRAADTPLRGIVHLRGLDIAPISADGEVDFEADDEWTIGSLLALVRGLATPCPLWVVSRGAWIVTGEEPAGALRPRAAAVWGLASVIAVERPELNVHCVDLDPGADGTEGLVAALFSDGNSVAVRGRQLLVSRLERHRPGEGSRPLRAEVARVGTLDGVELVPFTRRAPAPDEVALRVLAAGVNFRDVLMSLGMYPGDPVPLGVECVGVVTEVGADVRDLRVGDRVLGYVPGSLATDVTVPGAFLAPLPDGLATEDAAGIPVAFLTALYGLDRLAGLRAGERVLVHAAAGGVGLAAVQLAQRAGAEVFATAGSVEKRAFLRSLGVRQVMNSRSLDFADEVRTATDGAGVDVVLNSLTGEFITASLGCLAAGGRFLELGKRDVLTPEAAKRLRPDIAYYLYDLGAELQNDRGLARPMLADVLAGITAGALRPLPTTAYPLDRLRDAFRFMAQARHIGKIVLRPPVRGQISDRATYWITGGLGALGLATARWLVDRGARTLVLTGRRSPTEEAGVVLRELRELGANVQVRQADVGDRAAMVAIRDEIRATLPPLRGVFHAAGTVQDAVLAHQDAGRCREVLRGKAHGAFILHDITREDPLDLFVLYSAAGVLLGAGGQGVYTAANAELDALALARRRGGLPALSVAWGSWSGAGMAAQLAERGRDVWAARGLKPLNPDHGFRALERLLSDDTAHAAVLPIDWSRFLETLPPGADRRFFSAVARSSPAPAVATPAQASLVARLRDLPAARRRPALLDHLSTLARRAIGLDASTQVDPGVPLKEFGLDSLMAVELRNALARAFARPLPATLLFDYPTLDALTTYLARSLALDEPEATDPGRSKVDEIARLSDDEAEALLLRELDSAAERTHGTTD